MRENLTWPLAWALGLCALLGLHQPAKGQDILQAFTGDDSQCRAPDLRRIVMI